MHAHRGRAVRVILSGSDSTVKIVCPGPGDVVNINRVGTKDPYIVVNFSRNLVLESESPNVQWAQIFGSVDRSYVKSSKDY